MKKLGSYRNGNYDVTIYDDGTKVRRTEEDDFIPEFPENIDVKITDNCQIGCQFCFVEDTEISTDAKTKKIQDIGVGDVVQSYNEITNQFELRKVIQTHKRPYSGKLITIELEDGNVIKCTPNHKIYTTNRGWITADSISENDDIKVYK